VHWGAFSKKLAAVPCVVQIVIVGELLYSLDGSLKSDDDERQGWWLEQVKREIANCVIMCL
jgi:hypothetical protein